MLFKHQHESFNTQAHTHSKKVNRMESKLNQFKIPNPLQNSSSFMNQNQIPNMPTAIKNQLAGMDFLSISNVNNIGNMPSTGPFPVNKRNSRFSKRLMEMQKAFQMQDMKMRGIETGGTQHQDIFVAQHHSNSGQFMSMMDQEQNSMDMMGEHLDREIEVDMDVRMCGEESEVTEIEYSQNENRQEINYDQYQSYLNV